MTPQELKASILQLAIQGKLVEQRPEEGTGEELFLQIQAEKQRLIKAGTIKKEKPLPEITEDEIVFDIPDTWKHVKLGEVFCLEMGQSPDGNTVSETGDGIEFHQGKVYFGKMELQLSPQKTTSPTKYAQSDSALLCVRAPVGKVNITKRKVCIGRGLCAVKPICGISVEFVYYWLATLENTFIKKATGTTFVAITGEVVKNQVIPLPPLAEQKRIVAKIEELLPYIDRYEKAWSRLEDFNKRFPVDMQKSILQMAIQGKLVEQRPEEGTGEELYQQIQAEKQKLIKAGKIKKEKPLQNISDYESDIDIPDSWCLCKLAEVSSKITDGEHKTPKRVPSFCGYYLLSARNIRDGYITLHDVDYVDYDEFAKISQRCNPRKGDILISCSGSVGRCAVVTDDNNYVMVRSAAMVSPVAIDQRYLMHTLQSEYVQEQIRNRTKQTAQANLFQEAIRNLVIPLPPLAEQKRIVAKLEEILPLCERLK